MTAAVDGGVVVYLGYTNTAYGVSPGWYVVGGTSEATPVFSGIVAIADQAAHHDLGWLNPRLYALGDGSRSGIADITAGDNSVSGTQQLPPVAGQTFSVQGFDAVSGYDLASGLGTADGARLVGALAGSREHGAATEKAHWAGPPRAGPIPPGPRHPECQTVPRPSSPSMPRAPTVPY